MQRLARGLSLLTLVVVLTWLARSPAAVAAGEDLSYRLFLREGYRSLAGGDTFKARDYFTKACNLNVQAAESRFALADALMMLGQYGEAVIQLRHGIRADPTWTDREISRYAPYEKPAALDRMLEDQRRQVSRLPGDWACRIVLGYNLYFMGELADSYELFSEANEILHRDHLCTVFLKAIVAKGYSPIKKEGEAAPEEEKPKKSSDKGGSPGLPQAILPAGSGGAPGGLPSAGDPAPGGNSVQFGPPSNGN